MPEAVKARLKEIYGDHYTDDIESRDGPQIIELAENVATGVPMGTPVFDGAREGDVSTMLAMAGLDTSGQSDLSDGRTGEQFDAKATVRSEEHTSALQSQMRHSYAVLCLKKKKTQ